MKVISKISLKYNKSETIKMIKNSLNLTTVESKDFLTQLLGVYEIDLTESTVDKLSEIINFTSKNITPDDVESYISNSIEFSINLEKALAWEESLSDEEKEHIKVLISSRQIGPAFG